MVLLFGIGLKLADSLSLVVSFPTMLIGFALHSQGTSFASLRRNWAFAILITVGSIGDAFVGGQLAGTVSSAVLLPVLAAILVISPVKVWPHGRRPRPRSVR
ncbi:hypothetical protein [Paraburkholderia dipogonis]|uniref:hypothetical protein n=1 Tax=Paraburkholderia dipogonis TaxID=1211383 RepID=UPI0038BE0146